MVKTIRTYLGAVKRNDGKAACEQLSELGQSKLAVDRSRSTCEKAAASPLNPVARFRISKVEIAGDRATAQVFPDAMPDGGGFYERYGLVRVDGEWRIRDAGG